MPMGDAQTPAQSRGRKPARSSVAQSSQQMGEIGRQSKRQKVAVSITVDATGAAADAAMLAPAQRQTTRPVNGSGHSGMPFIPPTPPQPQLQPQQASQEPFCNGTSSAELSKHTLPGHSPAASPAVTDGARLQTAGIIEAAAEARAKSADVTERVSLACVEGLDGDNATAEAREVHPSSEGRDAIGAQLAAAHEHFQEHRSEPQYHQWHQCESPLRRLGACERSQLQNGS